MPALPRGHMSHVEGLGFDYKKYYSFLYMSVILRTNRRFRYRDIIPGL